MPEDKRRVGDGWQEGVSKRHEEPSGDGGYVHAFEGSDGFAGVYVYQHLNCTLKIYALIVCLLFLDKALSNCWEERIFCHQSFPGLRSFQSGSFTPCGGNTKHTHRASPLCSFLAQGGANSSKLDVIRLCFIGRQGYCAWKAKNQA